MESELNFLSALKMVKFHTLALNLGGRPFTIIVTILQARIRPFNRKGIS